MNPKISVILPVYNMARYLKECLDSVCCQSLSDIELICVDDGSTDDSVEILRRYALKDDRIKVVEQQNATASVARNKGLSMAKGEFVSFLDSDDMYYGENALSTLYELAKKEGCPVAGGAYMAFAEKKGDLWKEARSPDGRNPGVYEYAETPFDYNYQMFIFNRQMLIDAKVRFPVRTRYQDPSFMVRAMHAAGRYVTCSVPVYLYRWGHQNFDWRSNGFQKMRDVLSGMTDVVNFSLSHGLHRLVAMTADRFVKNYAEAFFANDIPIDDIVEYKNLLLSLPAAETEKIRVAQRVVRNALLEPPRPKEKEENGARPKVSIVIPSLNTGAYVRECMESVIGQTLKEIEIICVDAGSTDGTLEILQSFAASDSRIHVIVSDRRSYGRQMNLGIDMARGDYIGIVEPDDYIDLKMYEKLYHVAVAKDLDFVKSDLIRFVTENGIEKKTYCRLTADDSWYNHVVDTQENPESLRLTLNNPTGIFKNDFLKKNDIRFNETPGASYQDVGFWLQTFILGRRAYFLNEAFYHYRSDNTASSCRASDRIYCINKEYHFVLEWLSYHPEFRKRFLPWVTWAKFGNYNFTLTLASDECILEYVMRMYGVFAEDESSGALQRSLMNPYQRKRLEALLSDPLSFAVSLQSENATAKLSAKLAGKGFEITKLVRNGQSRQIECRGVFSRAYKCYLDNGVFYTLKRILVGRKKK